MSTQSVTPNPQQPDPWAAAAQEYQKANPGAAPGATSSPAAAPNEDWKLWGAGAGDDQPKADWRDPIIHSMDADTNGNHPVKNLLLGAGQGVAKLVLHPVDSLLNSGAGSGNYPAVAYTGNKERDESNQENLVGPNSAPVESAQSGIADFKASPAHAIGSVLGPAALTAGVAKFAPEVASGLHEAAIGDPDAAALRGLHIPANSNKTLSTLKSVEGARPYLQGAKSLEDLQSRVPQAKAEIWQPYQEAIDKIGDNPVKGPDGMTTVRELENERLQTSALLRDLKARSPEAIQLAQQKGMSQADLMTRDMQIKAALDPHLERAGINPQEIRGRFGNVAQVGSKISGKSTKIETPQPYGIGKMMDMQIDNPRSWIGSPIQGALDLIAGRPIWRGLPTDVNLREGFRVAGPKPELGNYSPFSPKGLLGAPSEAAGEHYEFGTPVSRATVTPPPQTFPRLPVQAGEGEVQPMVGVRANQHPGVAEDFSRTRIAPSKRELSRMGGTTLAPVHQGLALPSGERLALPSVAGPGDAQPMVGVRAPLHPGVAAPFARERIAPTRFNSVASPEPIGGEITPEGQVARPIRGLLPKNASRARRGFSK